MTNKKEWKFSMDDLLNKIAHEQNVVHLNKEEVQDKKTAKKSKDNKHKTD